jgi:hypothetical protein
MWFRQARKMDDMERFDTASRGAFGSLLLLINLGPKRPHWIAASGAFLIIMAAFTGFATQQLLISTNACNEIARHKLGLPSQIPTSVPGLESEPELSMYLKRWQAP